jgi:RNA polymerase sigma-70 factor (ECF subfamily)
MIEEGFMSEEELELIQRAKAGDPDAFAELYDRHQPTIYRYISFRVGSAAVAEDLTSEVFVRLVEKIDQFTYRGRPLLAWLYTIAYNLVADHHRRKGRAEMLPLDEHLVADAPDPEKAAGLTLKQQRLGAAMEQLTEGQRQVILLKFFEGLDNKTVAQILGKTVGAVKSLQHRGLGALERIFERNDV